MKTITSNLSEDLISNLNRISKQLKIPKDQLIEKALIIYLDHIKKAEYIQSFKELNQDEEIISIAEEGMADYLNQILEKDETI